MHTRQRSISVFFFAVLTHALREMPVESSHCSKHHLIVSYEREERKEVESTLEKEECKNTLDIFSYVPRALRKRRPRV